VVAEDWDASSADIADGGGHVLDLLVPSRQAEHGLLVECDWDLLDGSQSESGVLAPHPKVQQVHELILGLAGKNRAAEMDLVYPQLRDELQHFVAQLLGVTQFPNVA